MRAAIATSILAFALALTTFATRLRHEVDLDALRSDLLEVIGDTVRPAHAGVWLRGH